MITNCYNQELTGSTTLQTSVANQEINTSGKRILNFELLNDQDCNISINGGSYIFIRANQGVRFPVVYSCKIQQSSITFNWIGQGG